MSDLSFIHRFVPAERPGLPTLLLLHGTGGDENDLLPLGRALLPGAALLAPRGQVLEGGMPRFFRRLAMGVFDVADLHRRTHELAGFVESAAAAYGFDPRTVIAAGFSNGANIAASLLLSHPGVLAGGALLHAMVPFEPREQPNLPGVPVLITAGRRDPMTPPEQAEHLAEIFRAGGAEVTLHWEPGGHALTPREVEAVQSWLAGVAARLPVPPA